MSEKEKLWQITIDDLVEPVDQARTVITLEGLQELTDSIKEVGVIEPLIVVKKGDKFEVVAGHRRFLAAKAAQLAFVPCIVKEIEPKDMDTLKLHENFFREAVNAVDEARFFSRMHEQHSLSLAELARMCCRSESYIANRVRLLSLDPSVLSALESGVINFSQAVEIGKCQDEKIRAELLRVVVENGATVQSVRIMRDDYESRSRSGDEALRYEPPAPGHYEPVKHMVRCPVCKRTVDITEIFPLSVCNRCHDEMVNSLKGGENDVKE